MVTFQDVLDGLDNERVPVVALHPHIGKDPFLKEHRYRQAQLRSREPAADLVSSADGFNRGRSRRKRGPFRKNLAGSVISRRAGRTLRENRDVVPHPARVDLRAPIDDVDQRQLSDPLDRAMLQANRDRVRKLERPAALAERKALIPPVRNQQLHALFDNCASVGPKERIG